MSTPERSDSKTYKKFLNKRTTTGIWDNFTAADDRLTAKCNLCKKIIKTVGGTTSGLRTHMRSIHKLNTQENTASSSKPKESENPQASTSKEKGSRPELVVQNEPVRKKTRVSDYYQSSHSVELVVSRMAALDGIPLSKFCTSEDMRRLFKNSGYNLPTSPASITHMVQKQSNNLKNHMITQFKTLKASYERFTLTFDEYTATNNKRYMNVNVHNKDLESNYQNLGLVRITGSMTADVGIQYLKERLHEFGINLNEDIIAFTTDGASVMTKMGKSFEGHHQVCLVHGIQLAVIDVLYKYQFQQTFPAVPSISIASPLNTDIEFETDSEDDNADQTDQGENDALNYVEIQPLETERPEFIYKNLINKVRKLVKLFRKSPTKNDLLQKYVVEMYKKEMTLILDCKTRWSSMADMIGRFLKLKDCVSKILIDLKLNSDFSLTELDLETLNNIYNTLSVVKATVLELCKRDANLLKADVALKFMLKKLDGQANDLSNNLAKALRKRIKERRLLISGVLQYLHDPETFFSNDEDDDTFIKPTSDEILHIVVNLLVRLKYNNDTRNAQRDTETMTDHEHDMTIEEPSTSLNTSSENEDTSIQKQLEREISKLPKTKSATSATSTDFKSIIRVEMCVFETAGGGREIFLSAAYRYLLSVVPTSVEAERAFSSVGYLCNKLRSSLSDSTLNALSFLRSHFQNKIK